MGKLDRSTSLPSHTTSWQGGRAQLLGRHVPQSFEQAAHDKPYPLTGEQHLYAGVVERELIYSCTLEGIAP
jgi:hypothetical protein